MPNKRTVTSSKLSKKKSKQGGRARPSSPCQEDSGDEESESPPSLSEVLDMPKFPTLEIIASNESVQETLEEGDW